MGTRVGPSGEVALPIPPASRPLDSWRDRHVAGSGCSNQRVAPTAIPSPPPTRPPGDFWAANLPLYALSSDGNAAERQPRIGRSHKRCRPRLRRFANDRKPRIDPASFPNRRCSLFEPPFAGGKVRSSDEAIQAVTWCLGAALRWRAPSTPFPGGKVECRTAGRMNTLEVGIWKRPLPENLPRLCYNNWCRRAGSRRTEGIGPSCWDRSSMVRAGDLRRAT